MIEKLVKVKWMGSNTPQIIVARTDARLTLTKLELLSLHKELSDFMLYYAKDFVAARINDPSVLTDDWDIQ